MNNKYRLFGKIPVVDILVVTVLACMLAAGIWLLTRKEVKEQTGTVAQAETVPFTATFLVEATQKDNVSLIAVGDPLYLENGTSVGKVTDVEVTPLVRYGLDQQSGKMIPTEIEDRRDVYITAECTATKCNDKGVYIGKKKFSLNNKIALGNTKYEWAMLITSINAEVAK